MVILEIEKQKKHRQNFIQIFKRTWRSYYLDGKRRQSLAYAYSPRENPRLQPIHSSGNERNCNRCYWKTAADGSYHAQNQVLGLATIHEICDRPERLLQHDKLHSNQSTRGTWLPEGSCETACRDRAKIEFRVIANDTTMEVFLWFFRGFLAPLPAKQHEKPLGVP